MSLKHTIIASIVMLASMVVLDYVSHAENTHLNKPFSTFPKKIGEWNGKEDHFEKTIYDKLGVDDSFLCHYNDSIGRYVQLYVGFHMSQREGDLIHSPKNCMPGSGWNIIHSSLEEIFMPHNNPDKIKVIKLIIKNGVQKQIVLYWYQSRGRIINSEYKQKIYLVMDSIMRNRTDGSFVRLLTPVSNGDENKALDTLKDFSAKLFPILNSYIPS